MNLPGHFHFGGALAFSTEKRGSWTRGCVCILVVHWMGHSAHSMCRFPGPSPRAMLQQVWNRIYVYFSQVPSKPKVILTSQFTDWLGHHGQNWSIVPSSSPGSAPKAFVAADHRDWKQKWKCQRSPAAFGEFLLIKCRLFTLSST